MSERMTDAEMEDAARSLAFGDPHGLPLRLLAEARRARDEVEDLRRQLDECKAAVPPAWCSECRADTFEVDEDGCCKVCGVDVVLPRDLIADLRRQLDEARQRMNALEAAALQPNDSVGERTALRAEMVSIAIRRLDEAIAAGRLIYDTPNPKAHAHLFGTSGVCVECMQPWPCPVDRARRIVEKVESDVSDD